jgi:hypothetical protein
MNSETGTYVCTLDGEGAKARLPQVHAMLARLRDRQQSEGRLVLSFTGGPETAALVEEFVRDESQCCGFFTFAVATGDDEVTLELTAPPQGLAMLDDAAAVFDPQRSEQERLAVAAELMGSSEVFDRGEDLDTRLAATERIVGGR